MNKLFMCLLFFAPMTWASETPFHVIIDPGHGGSDRGASRGHLQEAVLNLQVSHKLANKLRQDSRFKVTMTRTKDVFVSLKNRTIFAEKKGGDLFLSIHVNASEDPRARGGEIYFQNQLPADEESMFLANLEGKGHGTTSKDQRRQLFSPNTEGLSADVRSIVEDLERNNRIYLSGEMAKTLTDNWSGHRKSKRSTIRQAPFYVVSNVRMPSALVELGFLSNKKEGQRLKRSKYQDQLVSGLYKSLVKFKEVMDKTAKTQ